MEPPERSEKCKEMFSLLSEYLNMELPADTCREMEAHIAGCAPCVEFTESLKKTMELCRDYKPEELPAPLEDAAREELMGAYRKMMATRAGQS